MSPDLYFLSALDDFHFTVIFNCLPLEGKVPHDRMVAADEVFILIDVAALQCGCTSSVTFGDSFSSRRSLFSKLVLN